MGKFFNNECGRNNLRYISLAEIIPQQLHPPHYLPGTIKLPSIEAGGGSGLKFVSAGGIIINISQIVIGKAAAI